MGTITFTPEPDFIGTAKGVTYTITTDKGPSITSTYTPTVTGAVAVCSDPASETTVLPGSTIGVSYGNDGGMMDTWEAVVPLEYLRRDTDVITTSTDGAISVAAGRVEAEG